MALPSRPAFLRAVGLGAAVMLAYYGSVQVPFLFDDIDAVVNNPTIRTLSSAFAPPSDGSATTGRPLVNVTLALDYSNSGADARPFHRTNIVLHAVTALFLMGLVRRTLASPQLRSRFGADAPLLGFLAALLWALHPLQTETVVGIAQRTELLCGLFYLATLYTFSRHADGSGLEGRWGFLSFCCCLAGMASKEVMVTAPLVVLLFDRTFFAGSFAMAWQARRRTYLALASTWLLLAGLVLSRGGARGEAAGFGLGITPWSYLLTQADALVLYVRLALWPQPLVLDYGTDTVRSLGDVAWQGALVLGAFAATVWALVRRPVPGFFGAAFFLILAPSSSFVPLVTQTIAEHRMYLPLAALASGALVLLPRRALGLGALVALAWGGATILRTRDYRDAVTIWSDTVAKRPLNPRAHHNLALAYQARGDGEAAHREFARVIELRPGYAPARYNWGVALLARGRFDEASSQLAAAARLAPSLLLDPKFAEAQYELGRLAEREGNVTAAEARYREVIRLAPNHVPVRTRLGLLLARSDRLEPATDQFRALVELRPADADARANLGNVLLLLGRPREAIEHYEAALRLRPDDARLHESLRAAREALR